MIDIDHFKRYNDHFGHVQGDDCLKAVAQAPKRTARRAGDPVARYGGEEFAVIALACNVSQTAELASRIGVAVDGLRIPHPGSVRPWVSLSMGYAVALPGESPDSLIRWAKAALYQAKDAGRHCAMAAGAGWRALIRKSTGAGALAKPHARRSLGPWVSLPMSLQQPDDWRRHTGRR